MRPNGNAERSISVERRDGAAYEVTIGETFAELESRLWINQTPADDFVLIKPNQTKPLIRRRPNTIEREMMIDHRQAAALIAVLDDFVARKGAVLRDERS